VPSRSETTASLRISYECTLSLRSIVWLIGLLLSWELSATVYPCVKVRS